MSFPIRLNRVLVAVEVGVADEPAEYTVVDLARSRFRRRLSGRREDAHALGGELSRSSPIDAIFETLIPDGFEQSVMTGRANWGHLASTPRSKNFCLRICGFDEPLRSTADSIFGGLRRNSIDGSFH